MGGKIRSMRTLIVKRETTKLISVFNSCGKLLRCSFPAMEAGTIPTCAEMKDEKCHSAQCVLELTRIIVY